MAVTNGPNRSGLERAARLLFAASAAGEIGVGALALAFPQILALLLAAPLDASGLLVARMLGSAVLALGVTWWISRNEPLPQLSSRYAAGFVIYNLGMGVLFLLRALAPPESALPWVVAIVHVSAGLAFAAALFMTQRTAESGVKS